MERFEKGEPTGASPRDSFSVLVLGLLIIGLLAMVALRSGDAILVRAYHGDMGLASRILAGRAVTPIERYLAYWDHIVRQSAIIAGFCVLAVALASSSAMQRFLERKLASAPKEIEVTSTARARLPFIVATIFLFLQGLAILTEQELWPFSPYRMYAEIQTSQLESFQAWAVTDSGERPLYADDFLPPFNNARLSQAIELLGAEGDSSDVRRGAQNLLQLYEHARVAGLHDGPPIEGIRMYAVRWTIEPELRNVTTPDARHLVGEYKSP